MSEKTINLADYQIHDKDTGSSSYQVALLTQRITNLTQHLSGNKHDVASRRGLLQMVARRRKLLDYLKRENFEAYTKTIQGLGLRR